MSEIDLDQYLQVFAEGQERGDAPVTTRTSERDLNVPFPVMRGHLQGPPMQVFAPRTVRAGMVMPRAVYTAAAPKVARPPLMFTTAVPTATSAARYPAAQAAGGSLPSPSPAMGASSPPPPDATAMLPAPETAFPSSINTNVAPSGANVTCPPCSCPGGISTGSILALLAAAGFVSYLLTQREK